MKKLALILLKVLLSGTLILLTAPSFALTGSANYDSVVWSHNTGPPDKNFDVTSETSTLMDRTTIAILSGTRWDITEDGFLTTTAVNTGPDRNAGPTVEFAVTFTGLENMRFAGTDLGLNAPKNYAATFDLDYAREINTGPADDSGSTIDSAVITVKSGLDTMSSAGWELIVPTFTKNTGADIVADNLSVLYTASTMFTVEPVEERARSGVLISAANGCMDCHTSLVTGLGKEAVPPDLVSYARGLGFETIRF